MIMILLILILVLTLILMLILIIIVRSICPHALAPRSVFRRTRVRTQCTRSVRKRYTNLPAGKPGEAAPVKTTGKACTPHPPTTRVGQWSVLFDWVRCFLSKLLEQANLGGQELLLGMPMIPSSKLIFLARNSIKWVCPRRAARWTKDGPNPNPEARDEHPRLRERDLEGTMGPADEHLAPATPSP